MTSFNRFARLFVVTSLIMTYSFAVRSQEATPITVPPVIVVGFNDILQRSQIGREIDKRRETELQQAAATIENLQARLEEEEQEIAAAREQLTPEEFNQRVTEFNLRTEEIRAETDLLGGEVEQRIRIYQNRLLSALNPIYQQRGVLVVLPREIAYYYDSAIDATEFFIEILDADFESDPEQLTELVFAPISADEEAIENEAQERPLENELETKTNEAGENANEQ